MSPREKKSESFAEEPDDLVLLNEENRKAAERHVVRKLDMRLMPTVVILYLMNYIDVGLSIAMVGALLMVWMFFRSSVWLSLLLDFRV